MITKTFTRKNGGKVFVIMGICWLAGTAALWAGVGVRKGGGSVIPGLPPGSEPPGTQAKARILLAGAPTVHKVLPQARILPDLDAGWTERPLSAASWPQ
jgi:hypothetical protein